MSRGELIGALSFGLADLGEFADEQEGIARQVADQLAIAIQQARLHEQVQRHAEELEQQVADRTRELLVLYEVAALANQPLDLETTLARSLEQVLGAVGSEVGAIHLLDEADGASGEEMLHLVVQRGFSPGFAAEVEWLPTDEGLGGWVVEHDEPLIVPDTTLDPRTVVTLPSVEPFAYTGIPLRAGGRTLGVLSVVRGTDQPPLNVEEISLLTSIADQLGVVVEGARLRERAEQAAVLEERGRLARDLHDSVTQLLYSVNLFATSGQNALNAGNQSALKTSLTKLAESAQQALREMRLLIYELRPLVLEQEGLVGALQRRLDAVEGRVGIATQLLASEMIELPGQVEEELYRIGVEALNNALKYAKATLVIVSISVDQEQIQLAVMDNGIGFDLRVVERKGGLGIIGMRERAEKLGGALEVVSAPGEGTSVRATLGKE
jgi:signal transduction histidine kinase